MSFWFLYFVATCFEIFRLLELATILKITNCIFLLLRK